MSKIEKAAPLWTHDYEESLRMNPASLRSESPASCGVVSLDLSNDDLSVYSHDSPPGNLGSHARRDKKQEAITLMVALLSDRYVTFIYAVGGQSQLRGSRWQLLKTKPYSSLKRDRRASVDVVRQIKSAQDEQRRHSSELAVSAESVKIETEWDVTA